MRKYFEVLLRIVAGKCWGFLGDTIVNNPPANAGAVGDAGGAVKSQT